MPTTKKTSAARKPAAAEAKAIKKNYDKPDLREKLKAAVVAGDKGGKPGQWSARKAQLLAHEYEAAGGGYLGPKTEAQAHLTEWTGEEWQTSDHEPARRGETTTRYLPKKAWDKLSAGEKKATNARKKSGSKTGHQFVANTAPAKRARKAATKSAAAKK